MFLIVPTEGNKNLVIALQYLLSELKRIHSENKGNFFLKPSEIFSNSQETGLQTVRDALIYLRTKEIVSYDESTNRLIGSEIPSWPITVGIEGINEELLYSARIPELEEITQFIPKNIQTSYNAETGDITIAGESFHPLENQAAFARIMYSHQIGEEIGWGEIYEAITGHPADTARNRDTAIEMVRNACRSLNDNAQNHLNVEQLFKRTRNAYRRTQ